MGNPKDSVWRATPELMRGTKHLQVRVLPATIAAIDALVAKGHIKGHAVDALVAVAMQHPDEVDAAIAARRGHDDKKPADPEPAR